MEADVRGSILQSKPDVIFDTTFGRNLEVASKFLCSSLTYWAMSDKIDLSITNDTFNCASETSIG